MNKIKSLLTLLLAITFGVVFYQERIGLNLLLFEIPLIIISLAFHRDQLHGGLTYVFLGGAITSLTAYILNGSYNAFIINIISMVCFNAMLSYKYRSIFYMIIHFVANLFTSVGRFFREFSIPGIKTRSKVSFFAFIKLAIIPAIIIILFYFLYRGASPFFKDITQIINEKLTLLFEKIADLISIPFFLLLVLGMFLSAAFIYVRKINATINEEGRFEDDVIRKRKKRGFTKKLGLLNEHRSGIILLVSLNLMIALFNALDIYNVWFNFEWDQGYLKQFVHQGTYLLIIALLISIVIVLYFFRKNLNFYSKNKFLKILSYIWLAQNAIMVISVGIRNLYYIRYFNLAYLRIGVILFLIASIVGIATVYLKVRFKKSSFFLVRWNMLSIYLILMLNGLINWDVFIAKYNFSHYHKSFVHLDFMAKLSDKALPYLDKEMEELSEIEQVQEDTFFDSSSSISRKKYMDKEEYHKTIQSRMKDYVSRRDSLSWLSWTLADQKAYEYCKDRLSSGEVEE